MSQNSTTESLRAGLETAAEFARDLCRRVEVAVERVDRNVVHDAERGVRPRTDARVQALCR